MCKLNKVSAEARKERGREHVYENVFSGWNVSGKQAFGV